MKKHHAKGLFGTFLVLIVLAELFSRVSALAASNWGWPYPTRESLGNFSINGAVYSVYLLAGNSSVKQTQLLNEALKDRNSFGHLENCRRIIEIPVGTADGDHSYGGLCLLNENSSKLNHVMICNDDLVGHFKIRHIQRYEDNISDLIRFVIDNCTGG